MCGIFLLLNNNNKFSDEFVKSQFEKGSRRGPEKSRIVKLDTQRTIGFHRLAINGLDDNSCQPFFIQNTVLVCNGEIYNHKALAKMGNFIMETNSDCEIIIHLYRAFGISQTLQMLDGVFSFALHDTVTNTIYVARDPYGVRPLYYLTKEGNSIIGFASELKVLHGFCDDHELDDVIQHVQPGTVQTLKRVPFYDNWAVLKTTPYFLISSFSNDTRQHINTIYENISFHLQNAVNKRCATTDRPIACLLSGGLDSSLITALVNEYYKKNMPGKILETYSIGLAGSEDLKYAKIVADYLKTAHTEIILTEDEFVDSIPEVIYDIESYDTTSVRACLGNHALGKYISKHSDAKVIFNGDGSDELTGGYLYMSKAPNAIEFDKETRRLLSDIYLFDVLRSDKSISTHGLEPRTPFLDISFTQYYLSIPAEIRFHPANLQCEKYLLRQSFAAPHFYNMNGNTLLPTEILWRKKEAFSDGVSSQERSLYTILQEKISNKNIQNKTCYYHLPPTTKEQFYYRRLFDNFYYKHSNIVPYFWMPKYIEATDPSARTLDIYNNTKKQ